MIQNKQTTTSSINLTSDIDELYVFGDLLSDTGNLFEITSFNRILENPAQFGFTNVSDRFIATTADDSGIQYEVIDPNADPDEYAFFGSSVPSLPAQPSAATHDLIAEVTISALASQGIDATEKFANAIAIALEELTLQIISLDWLVMTEFAVGAVAMFLLAVRVTIP